MRTVLGRYFQETEFHSSANTSTDWAIPLISVSRISAPRRDTEQTDHTGYNQPSRFWLRDRNGSQDVERELLNLTRSDLPIK